MAKATFSSETAFSSQLASLQTDLASTRADLSTACSSAAFASEVIDTRRAANGRLSSQVSDLTSTVDTLRIQLAASQSSVSPADLKIVCSKHDRYLSLCSQIDRLNNDFTTFITLVKDSRSSLRLGIGPLLDEFSTLPENADMPKGGPVTSPTE